MCSAIAARTKLLFWWLNLRFSDSSLDCTCSGLGEGAVCVNMSIGLRVPFGVCVEATAWKQASYVTKCSDYNEDPGHRHPSFPAPPLLTMETDLQRQILNEPFLCPHWSPPAVSMLVQRLAF